MREDDLIERLRAAAAREGRASSDHELNPDVLLPPGRILREAAVLLALGPGPRGAELVLTKRSSRLAHHPGQIALPGGKLDAGESHEAAALREAEEEIGLPRADVEVLGRLPAHETVTGFCVTPVLGWVARPFAPVAEAGEVEEVFRVPFAHVADPARYAVEGRRFRGRRRFYYTVPWGPYYIWGATARILRALAERLA